VGKTQDAGTWIEGLDEAIDLRRRSIREKSSRIIRRAHWLDDDDREIVIAYFERGMHASKIGAFLKTDPRLIRRRLRHIILRLEDPRCAYVVAHRNAWSARRRAIAEDLFIRGRSMREISKERGLSLYSVRKHRDAIEAMTIAQTLTDRPSRTWQYAERG
jgi:DNA-binding CsgD family transcriptional regulator